MNLLRHEVGLSERRACGLLGLSRSTYRYAPRAPGALELRVVPLVAPRRANERWAMDFMTDALSDGRRFRLLIVRAR